MMKVSCSSASVLESTFLGFLYRSCSGFALVKWQECGDPPAKTAEYVWEPDGTRRDPHCAGFCVPLC